MDEDDIKKIVKEELVNSQYGVKGVPYHIHSGTDAPRIPISSLRGTFYEQVVTVLGGGQTTPFYPFGAQTSPVSGTITTFAVISHGLSGTATLWATTAGTISTISTNASPLGTFVGTAFGFTGVKILAGDVVKITPTNTNAMTCITSFQYSPP